MFKLLLSYLILLPSVVWAGTYEKNNTEGFQAARQYTGELLSEKENFSGHVLDIIDVADYTYVQFAKGKEKLWLATNKISVKKGDFISFNEAQPMHKFHSKTLNRTFDEIYFVTQLNVKTRTK